MGVVMSALIYAVTWNFSFGFGKGSPLPIAIDAGSKFIVYALLFFDDARRNIGLGLVLSIPVFMFLLLFVLVLAGAIGFSFLH